MKMFFGKLVVSPANVLGTAMVVGYIAVSTLLFTHVSDRLDKALQRVDKLELFITNTIASQDTHIKERTLNWLETVKHEIGEMVVRRTENEETVRTRRDDNVDKHAASVNTKIAKIYARIARIASRHHPKSFKSLKKMKQNNKAARKSALPSRKKKRSEALSKCNATNGSNKNKKTHAWFIIWGSRECLSGSRLIQTGQMVSTKDGSDYLCLPDKGNQSTYRKTSNRKVHQQHSVTIRGVTYGDIEDVFSLDFKPLPANESKRNYRLVPCAVCSRADKTASVMLLSQKENTLKDFKNEYSGVLMSTNQSNAFACVSLNPKTYPDKMEPLVNPVQLHPVELKCDSLYCEASSNYDDKHRIQCVVGTI